MGWAFFYMFVILKIPILAALYICWWSSRSPDEQAGDAGAGGGGTAPHRPRPSRPRPTRRGPHRGPRPSSPARTRTVARLRRVHSIHR